MSLKLCIYFVVLFLIGKSLGNEWPSDIVRCKNEDSNCLAKITTEVIKKNAAGRPDIGLIKYDPLFIKKIVASQGGSGGVSLDLTFTDLTVDGLSTIVVDRSVGFANDPASSKFEFYGAIPLLHLKGKYTAGGRILVLPIQGNGDAEFTFENAKFAVKFKPKVATKDGKAYLDIDKVKVLIEPGGIKFKLDDLFNGDKALGDNMNTFLNENWKDVWSEVSNSIDNTFASVVKDILMGVFKSFPYENLFTS